MCWGFSKETSKIIFEPTEQNVGRLPSKRKDLTKFKSGLGIQARTCRNEG